MNRSISVYFTVSYLLFTKHKVMSFSIIDQFHYDFIFDFIRLLNAYLFFYDDLYDIYVSSFWILGISMPNIKEYRNLNLQ